MKKSITLLSSFFLVCGMTFGVLAVGQTEARAEEQLPSPRIDMQTTLDQLVNIVTEYSGDENSTVRRDKMRAVIEPKFNFEEMAKRSLGVKWKSITEVERKEFVDLFSELLARTYLGRIEKVEKDMVEIRSETLRPPRALVKTTVTFEGDTFPLDYKLLFENGGWQVYDVIIENIGLVSNYRSEFAGIIRKEKFSGLLEMLREKNAKATS